jgi:hypothetical protein
MSMVIRSHMQYESRVLGLTTLVCVELGKVGLYHKQKIGTWAHTKVILNIFSWELSEL